MQRSLKTGFAQIFSCRPKNLSCPKFGGAPAPLARPARTPMFLSLNGKTSRHRPPYLPPKKKTWPPPLPAIYTPIHSKTEKCEAAI